jgi:GNAT superfamily N-acetyltransferase
MDKSGWGPSTKLATLPDFAYRCAHEVFRLWVCRKDSYWEGDRAEMTIENLRLMRLDAEWASRALLLSDEAGWNQTQEDWEVFFRYGEVLGFAEGDRLVATAAALPYGESLGWVSMVLVTSAWRRRGLATELVRECTGLLRSAGRAALLDAAPAAAAIYAGLGYVALSTMERWGGPGSGESVPTSTVTYQLDREAFGADRSFLLQNFLARAGSKGFSAPTGFTILRQGRKTAHIGPLVANADEAGPLLEQAVAAAAGRVVIDVLASGNFLLPGLRALGFQRARPFTRMAVGISQLPGNSTRLLAAAGPEFG